MAFCSILQVLFLTLGVTFELALEVLESYDPTSSWDFFYPALNSSVRLGRRSRSCIGQELSWSWRWVFTLRYSLYVRFALFIMYLSQNLKVGVVWLLYGFTLNFLFNNYITYIIRNRFISDINIKHLKQLDSRAMR